MAPDDRISRLLEQLTALAEEFRRIEAESGARREAAIAASGLDPSMVSRMLGDSLLQPRHGYATVSSMPSTAIVTEKHPGPVADGAMGKLAAELGFHSLKALAAGLEESYATVRSWNRDERGLPSRVQAKVDKLRAKAKRRG